MLREIKVSANTSDTSQNGGDSSNTVNTGTSYLPLHYPEITPCPSCGYCPHCGRGGYRTVPYYPTAPTYPWNNPIPATTISW